MGEDRYDYGVRQLISDNQGLFYCVLTLAGFVLLHELCPDTSQPRVSTVFICNLYSPIIH